MEKIHCPQCESQLIQFAINYGVGLACPLCKQAYTIADYVAHSSTFSPETQVEAEKVGEFFRMIGLVMFGIKVIDLLSKPKKRR